MGRGSTNGYKTGNSYDRWRRRQWMIETFGVPRQRDGRKTRIPCFWCRRLMRAEPRRKPALRNGGTMLCHTWEVDRWPVCGHDGGRYRRGNIVPSCPRCNGTRCTVMGKRCRGRAPQTRRALSARL